MPGLPRLALQSPGPSSLCRPSEPQRVLGAVSLPSARSVRFSCRADARSFSSFSLITCRQQAL